MRVWNDLFQEQDGQRTPSTPSTLSASSQIDLPSYIETLDGHCSPETQPGTHTNLPSYDKIVSTQSQTAPEEQPETVKPARIGDDPILSIHPFANMEGVLVSVQPPENPPSAIGDRVPCDIVLVIDVSTSMNETAPAPTDEERGIVCREDHGQTVFSLVQRAARSIISNLDANDRLAIVTFGTAATVVKSLAKMNESERQESRIQINKLRPNGVTNLWGGIQSGLQLFADDKGPRGLVQALLVLTDGRPNHLCPGDGYVAGIRSFRPQPELYSTAQGLPYKSQQAPPSIHTFGFGYNIRSGLLKTIAEAGRGNFVFIPDSGMTGTVFNHAVAHMQTTFATNCELRIVLPEGIPMKTLPVKTLDHKHHGGVFTFDLGNLQYGQSRDLCLFKDSAAAGKTFFDSFRPDKLRDLEATLTFTRMGKTQKSIVTRKSPLDTITLPKAVVAYHQSRTLLCGFLASFYRLKSFDGYEAISLDELEVSRKHMFESLMETIPAVSYSDNHNKSLMQDLTTQIHEALSNDDNWERWGQHYFLSLWTAHAKQLRNSFKDSGPQQYNKNKFFTRCLEKLDEGFDNEPALPIPGRENQPIPTIKQMKIYNSSTSSCFAASSRVLLATGLEAPVRRLNLGECVQTAAGPRQVRAVLTTRVLRLPMGHVGDGLIITPWHPIALDKSESLGSDERQWIFPVQVAQSRVYTGLIYSVLLEPDENPDAHTLRIGGVWVATLGHGLLTGDDVRAHSFWGNYEAVWTAMKALRQDDSGAFVYKGVTRDSDTNEVCGFEALIGNDQVYPATSHAREQHVRRKGKMPTKTTLPATYRLTSQRHLRSRSMVYT